MRMRPKLMVLAVLCCLAWAGQDASLAPASKGALTSADAITIPRLLSYQGKLTDTMFVPVPDTLYSVRFRLYTQASGGTHFWEETCPVRTRDGVFTVLLGSVTPIGTVPDGGNLYLGMRVESESEMTPRVRIVSAAYAYKADSADYAAAAAPVGTAGGDLDDSYPDPTVDGLQGRTVSAAAPRTGQVLKWTGSQWAPRDDSTGGSGGTVTSVSQGTGVICTPNPITTTGTVALDASYTDGRYVNDTGDSVAGRLVAANSRGICFEGRCSAADWSGLFENTYSSGGAGCFGFANHSASGYYAIRGSSRFGVGVFGWNDTTSYYALRAYNAAGSSSPGLHVNGTSYFTGAKTGFVADLCRNSGSEALEPGDVVVVTGCEPAVLGSVPVPLVARADRAGQTGVIGVVDSRQIVDPAGAEPDDGPTAIRANPAHVRHAPGPARPGDYLLVATLGAYQGVRVDASFGAVQPGDLLVASPRAGFAMVTEEPEQGTVVGKALAGLDAGPGLVPVMILQQ